MTFLLLWLVVSGSGEQRLRSLLAAKTGLVSLPAGRIQVSSELKLPKGSHDLTLDGGGATLVATASFQGKAILSCQGCRNLVIRNLSFDGNRAALERPTPLVRADLTFASFYPSNGILIEDTDGLTVDHVKFASVTNFALIVSASKNIFVDHVSVENSGSRNAKGRNNTSGGILLEQGVQNFTVSNSVFRGIRGNALWTHSCYGSPRNQKGKFANNQFFDIGRDAIQIGHATEVSVTGNRGSRIGMSAAEVDVENEGTPVGIDTAGNVDRSVYEHNRFEEVDGKCIDLDGFHDGTIRENVCINRGKPEVYPFGNFGISLNNTSIDMRSQNITIENNQLEGMKFGGIFVVGTGHRIVHNQMRRLNIAHCNESNARVGCLVIAGEPEFLESGIYLAKRANKTDPVRGATIENNTISGWKMAKRCIEAAPEVRLTDNKIRNNQCAND